MALAKADTPPWSKQYDFQEISPEQAKVRRVELLLLKDPAGYFLSHLISNTRLSPDDVKNALEQIKARKLDGFWVHPHYALNVPYRGLFPSQPESEKVIHGSENVIEMIRRSPDISIAQLLRLSKIKNPNDMVLLLKNQLRYGIETKTQFIAGNYLFRHFNIKCQIVC